MPILVQWKWKEETDYYSWLSKELFGKLMERIRDLGRKTLGKGVRSSCLSVSTVELK